MQDIIAQVLRNEEINSGFYRMTFATPWKKFVPGQFVMIKTGDSFLRRPFGLISLKSGRVEIGYKVVGKGTASLSRLTSGEKLKVLGPIGNGFATLEAGTRLLVAGGYGIAPIKGLISGFKNKKDIHLFYGARRKEDLLYLKEIEKEGVTVHISTEDASCGEKGLVTDALSRFLETISASNVSVYACGPNSMLKAVRDIYLKNKNIIKNCQLSLEAHMGCGIGVCLGCVVKDIDGKHVRVCKEGPVFSAEQVRL